jgi:hypothetical protein
MVTNWHHSVGDETTLPPTPWLQLAASLTVFYDGYPFDAPLAVVADTEHAKLGHIIDWRVTRHLVLAHDQVVVLAISTAQYAGSAIWGHPRT